MIKENDIEVKRHSLSHVLAAAVTELYPNAKLAIGPAIDNGFYYDFDLAEAFNPNSLSKIEKRMREIINQDRKFVRREVSGAEALKLFADQPYKVELIKELTKDEVISLYDTGDFVDLCRGPHVTSTKELKSVGFKLDKLAGAYWRGSEKNKMLQRIYGLAFETAEKLNEYVEMMKEAEKRDHKKLGRELDLFSFHPEAPGMPFWHEKGMIIWNNLEKLGKEIRKKHGYIEIKTPLLAKNSLWITSGHWDHYKDDMYSLACEGETYCLKPMDCPFNIKIYQTKGHSYKELPIRFTEIGINHRNEKSGELNGLFRVRQITQDDSHVFLREDQIKTEIVNLLKMVDEFYQKLNLKPAFFLSTRPDDFIGEISTWDKAEADLREALQSENIEFGIKEKDGAFYGPKIDVNIKDVFGRSWQVATIQLDFQLPGRFNCEYVAENGCPETPVMIHAAIFGSFERMIGILIEHFGGAFPLWLAPVQLTVLPIADRHLEYSKKILDQLSERGLRANIDDRSESIGKKIREAEMQKVPYMLIVGDKEIESEKIAVRRYGKEDLGQLSLQELYKEMNV